MKKKRVIFHYITLAVICQVFGGIWGDLGVKNAVATGKIFGEMAVENTANGTESAGKITSAQKTAPMENCEAIKESLQAVQRNDARARVYLGRKYETILTKYVTPLNVRLVEANISDTGLIKNQSALAERRTKFINDYVTYQQGLEDLVATDCQGEPERFYEKLKNVREMRARVKRDTERMLALTREQVKLVGALKQGLFSAEGTATKGED